MDKTIKYIIGIDEVGRGPIAGPVAVCAFKLLITDYQLLVKNAKEELKIPLRDSKKLSKKQRELWFKFLKKLKEEGNCDYVVSFVSPLNIDKFGIAKCIQKALNKSLIDLKLKPEEVSIFLDGGLHAPIEYLYQETIIKGDELHPIISMASIMAKVSRDRVMTNFSKEYPYYGFENHSGYGTKAHYDAIKKLGQTPIHRQTFIHFVAVQPLQNKNP
jgi:ribonuclease HII